ncbi:hypothetical protein BB560_006866 [Smittium megazygosporum]|uniref:RING-type domain-containing protein n=1 Tax=Smittium megazygosporum TaxID=133381 RepID=A0A2T9Y0N0_9FUNG|nr:hypothetical protein BB560_006866 [Smittium megazygosporum]
MASLNTPSNTTLNDKRPLVLPDSLHKYPLQNQNPPSSSLDTVQNLPESQMSTSSSNNENTLETSSFTALENPTDTSSSNSFHGSTKNNIYDLSQQNSLAIEPESQFTKKEEKNFKSSESDSNPLDSDFSSTLKISSFDEVHGTKAEITQNNTKPKPFFCHSCQTEIFIVPSPNPKCPVCQGIFVGQICDIEPFSDEEDTSSSDEKTISEKHSSRTLDQNSAALNDSLLNRLLPSADSILASLNRTLLQIQNYSSNFISDLKDQPELLESPSNLSQSSSHSGQIFDQKNDIASNTFLLERFNNLTTRLMDRVSVLINAGTSMINESNFNATAERFKAFLNESTNLDRYQNVIHDNIPSSSSLFSYNIPTINIAALNNLHGILKTIGEKCTSVYFSNGQLPLTDFHQDFHQEFNPDHENDALTSSEDKSSSSSKIYRKSSTSNNPSTSSDLINLPRTSPNPILADSNSFTKERSSGKSKIQNSPLTNPENPNQADIQSPNPHEPSSSNDNSGDIKSYFNIFPSFRYRDIDSFEEPSDLPASASLSQSDSSQNLRKSRFINPEENGPLDVPWLFRSILRSITSDSLTADLDDDDGQISALSRHRIDQLDYFWNQRIAYHHPTDNQTLDDIISELMFSTQHSSMVPASVEVVQSLVRKLPQDSKRFLKECSVCLEEYKPDSLVIELKCEHIFHEQCLLQWARINGSCPVCRKPLSESANIDPFPRNNNETCINGDTLNICNNSGAQELNESENLSLGSQNSNEVSATKENIIDTSAESGSDSKINQEASGDTKCLEAHEATMRDESITSFGIGIEQKPSDDINTCGEVTREHQCTEVRQVKTPVVRSGLSIALNGHTSKELDVTGSNNNATSSSPEMNENNNTYKESGDNDQESCSLPNDLPLNHNTFATSPEEQNNNITNCGTKFPSILASDSSFYVLPGSFPKL